MFENMVLKGEYLKLVEEHGVGGLIMCVLHKILLGSSHQGGGYDEQGMQYTRER